MNPGFAKQYRRTIGEIMSRFRGSASMPGLVRPPCCKCNDKRLNTCADTGYECKDFLENYVSAGLDDLDEALDEALDDELDDDPEYEFGEAFDEALGEALEEASIDG